jgi:hypothetical protein
MDLFLNPTSLPMILQQPRNRELIKEFNEHIEIFEEAVWNAILPVNCCGKKTDCGFCFKPIFGTVFQMKHMLI